MFVNAWHFSEINKRFSFSLKNILKLHFSSFLEVFFIWYNHCKLAIFIYMFVELEIHSLTLNAFLTKKFNLDVYFQYIR